MDSVLPNTVVLTPGLSGSSVLTGLLMRAGYWPGAETDTVAWETHENSRLVELNRRILSCAGFGWHDIMDLPPPSEAEIRGCGDSPALTSLAEDCKKHRPWVWKDPRLCYTIHAWARHLDLSQCAFVLMTRAQWVAWTGIVRRGGTVVSERDFRTVYENCLESAERFLDARDIQPLRLTFGELIQQPDNTIDCLNRFLGTDMDVDDLRAVYRGPLGKRRHSRIGYWGARLRYVGKLLLGRVERLPRSPEPQ